MLFNSIAFTIFFPVVTILYFVMSHRFRWGWLLAASCIFYMSFVPAYIFILAFMITVDYFSAIEIERAASDKRKRFFLIASIVVNVGMLAFFKYYSFLNDLVTHIIFLPSEKTVLPVLSFLLPIGLSFHTFQSMSYTLEVYGGNQKAEKHFGIFALYVMFYPQLVAGPIERPQHLLPQLRIQHSFNYELVSNGLRRMLWGLFKKMVIADRLAFFVDPVFGLPHSYSGYSVVWATLFYTFQIYCDFSGYCDIAIGTASVMGFELTENFRSPLFSKSVTEFWQRWHISLASWLFDYVFKPISFLKKSWGLVGIVYSVMITFLLCGLWHGARLNFVVWGLLNGMALSYEIITKKLRNKYFRKKGSTLISLFSLSITFIFICLSFLVARAQSLPDAYCMLRSLPNLHAAYLIGLPIISKFSFVMNFVFIFLLMSAEWFFLSDKTGWKARFVTRVHVRYGATIFLLVMILLFGVFEQQSFIYFQF